MAATTRHFRLSIHLSVPLLEARDGGAGDLALPSFVQDFTIAIHRTNDAGAALRTAGKIAGYIVRMDHIRSALRTVTDVCDESRGTLDEYGATLFVPGGNAFSAAVERTVGHVTEPNVLVFDSVTIGKEWRGRGLGHRALDTAIDSLGSGCGLVALQPVPANFDEMPSAKSELHAYWRAVGFKRVGRSSIFVKRHG